MSKTILFLTQGGISKASSRFRVYQYLGSAVGLVPVFSYKVIPLLGSGIASRIAYIIRVLFSLPRFDTIFVQKVLFPEAMIRLLRCKATRLVYDWDDALYANPPGACDNESKHRSRKAKLDLMLAVSDTVICGNDVLKNYASRFCDDIRLIPTVVGYKSPRICEEMPSKIITIGWIGSSENLTYLKNLEGVFASLYEKYGAMIELKVVCDSPLFYKSSLVVVNKRWALVEEEEDIRSFDIGVMPLDDSEWARGKCAFKLLQYMALGVPAVASPVGANNQVIENGNNGFLAACEDEWFYALTRLIENKSLRHRIASAALVTIEERYSFNVNREKFMQAVIGG